VHHPGSIGPWVHRCACVRVVCCVSCGKRVCKCAVLCGDMQQLRACECASVHVCECWEFVEYGTVFLYWSWVQSAVCHCVS
jgi:hypothetical protein